MRKGLKLGLLSIGLTLATGVISNCFSFNDNKYELGSAEPAEVWTRATSIYDLINGETPIVEVLFGVERYGEVQVITDLPREGDPFVNIQTYRLMEAGDFSCFSYSGIPNTFVYETSSYYTEDYALRDMLSSYPYGSLVFSDGWGDLLSCGREEGNMANIHGGMYSCTYPHMANTNGSGGAINISQFVFNMNNQGIISEYSMDRWLFIDDNGSLVCSDCRFSEYAVRLYVKKSGGYNITLNNRDGTSQTTVGFPNQMLPSVPTPDKPGFVFKGYYDLEQGGTQYIDRYGFPTCQWNDTSKTTLHAQYYREHNKNDLVSNLSPFTTLQEDVITVNNSTVTASFGLGHELIANSSNLVFDKPATTFYTLTGNNNAQGGSITFAKPYDEETTFYIKMKDFTYFNNNWGGGFSLQNKYVVRDDDGGVASIENSTTPIHYVVLLEGSTVISGHNQTGFGFDYNPLTSPLRTLQFATLSTGTFTVALTYPNCANSIAFRANEPLEQLIPLYPCNKYTSIRLGKGKSNINSPTSTTLNNRINTGTDYVDYPCTDQGLIDATIDNFGRSSGTYSVEKYPYDTFQISLAFEHNYTHVDEDSSDCQNSGVAEHYVCDCDKYYVLENGEYVEVDYSSLILPPNPHVHNPDHLTKVDAVEPQCLEGGNIEYYVCSDCGQILVLTPEGYVEATFEDIILAPHGHNYTNVITKMPTTEEEGVMTYTCIYCGDTYTESIDKLPTPPSEEDLTPEEYEEQQKQYEEQQQQAVDTMIGALDNVVTVPEEPSAEDFDTEEEYLEQLEKYEEKQSNAEQLNQALEIISEINNTDTSSSESTVSQDVKKQAQENVVNITDTVSNELSSLNDEKSQKEQELEELLTNFDPNTASPEEIKAVEEKKQEIQDVEDKQEIVEVVTTQAVVVTAKQTDSENIANEANLGDVPADAGLGNMGETFSNFMQIQINDMIGNGSPTPQINPRIKCKVNPNTGIDFNLKDNLKDTKKMYQQVNDFVDMTVSNASTMAQKIRNCSGVESKVEIKVYINKITTESFRDFDKEAADAEFAENAYKAVLRYMQSQVLASLESSKPSGNYEQLQTWQEEYDAVSDIEEFEIMVVEVMRRKYNTLAATPIDDVDDFYPVYREIFENWALNKEDNSGITLEQLTSATIDETKARVGAPIVYTKLEEKETAGIAIIAAIAVVVIATCAIVPTVVSKKKRGGNK